MKYKISLFLLLGLIMSGCATLTNTQIESVNQYAIQTKNFSTFPSRIMTELAEVRVKRGVCFSNSIENPKLHIEALDSLYSNKINAYRISKKVDITFLILDKYAQSLALLSSDKYQKELTASSKNIGIGLDTLVSTYNRIDPTAKLPCNIGSSIGCLIAMGGKQYIRTKQAKEIKRFVSRADTIVGVMTNNLLQFLESENIVQLIEAEEWGIHQNYLSFLRQKSKPLLEEEYVYLDLKERMDRIRGLREETVRATIQMRKAHQKLLESIKKRMNLTDIVVEVQVLSEDVKSLRKLYLNN